MQRSEYIFVALSKAVGEESSVVAASSSRYFLEPLEKPEAVASKHASSRPPLTGAQG
jgi:hypothetical protein